MPSGSSSGPSEKEKDSPIKTLPENSEEQQPRQEVPPAMTTITNVAAMEKASVENAATVVTNRFDVLEMINEEDIEEPCVERVLDVMKVTQTITESGVATNVVAGTSEVATGLCVSPNAEIVDSVAVVAETDCKILNAPIIAKSGMHEGDHLLLIENVTSLFEGNRRAANRKP
ncbi:OLC1v1036637C1 [Oldenlandia corymbosa var. corymbosa]|uniref:OLC1v1036637C1 n=1 Tax=Oldenlandia corymbosa var. corymbosa TaxID=529605 RepID=A0AAV1CWZ7_OLDCO|nr:OLC1v1036637C1 [Oldenlandia corymbosa var. corymbosa]